MSSQQYSQQFIDTFSEAEELGNSNRLSESLEKYESLRQQQPDNVSVLNNMGLVHEKLGDLEQAIKFYKRCLELMPGQIVLINNLANSYARLEKWSEACPLLKQLVESDFDKEKNSEKYSLCLFNTQPKKETAEFISSVIEQYPENRLLNRLLGNSLLHLNQHDDGLKRLKHGSGFIEIDDHGTRLLV